MAHRLDAAKADKGGEGNKGCRIDLMSEIAILRFSSIAKFRGETFFLPARSRRQAVKISLPWTDAGRKIV
jgi:hypothetical protein